MEIGKKGCLTGISGLKIAYLSGLQSKERELSGKRSSGAHSTSMDRDNIYFSKTDIDEMINSLESETVIDILLTSQWPKSITKYAVSVVSNLNQLLYIYICLFVEINFRKR